MDASGSESFGFSFTGNSGMPGFGSGAAHGDFTRIPDLGIRRCGLSGSGVMATKIHWEEDEFRYWGFMHMKALDAAGQDTAFALGFWDVQRQDL